MSTEVPEGVTLVQFDDVARAAHKIRRGANGRGIVQKTPMSHSAKFSALVGCEVHFKREYTHETGSFKARGAANAILSLTAEERKHGVIAASAGNHAQALAFHAREHGIAATVAMPRAAPAVKVQNCRDLGAVVRLEGDHIGQSRDWAMKHATESGMGTWRSLRLVALRFRPSAGRSVPRPLPRAPHCDCAAAGARGWTEGVAEARARERESQLHPCRAQCTSTGTTTRT